MNTADTQSSMERELLESFEALDREQPGWDSELHILGALRRLERATTEEEHIAAKQAILAIYGPSVLEAVLTRYASLSTRF